MMYLFLKLSNQKINFSNITLYELKKGYWKFIKSKKSKNVQ